MVGSMDFTCNLNDLARAPCPRVCGFGFPATGILSMASGLEVRIINRERGSWRGGRRQRTKVRATSAPPRRRFVSARRHAFSFLGRQMFVNSLSSTSSF
jgi:hypothetical protein